MRYSVIWCCVVAVGAPWLCAADITDLNGKVLRGQVVALTADSLSVKDEAGVVVKLALKTLAMVDLDNKLLPLPGAYDEAELTDGSILRLTDFKLKQRQVILDVAMAADTAPKPTIAVPMTAVFTWLRNAPQGNNRNDLRTTITKRGSRDLLMTRQKKGDVDVLVPSEGTVLEGSEDGTKITYNNNVDAKTTLPIARFSGLVLNQATQAVVPPTICRVVDVFGNTLVATKIDAVSANGSLALTVMTVAGAEYRYPSLASLSKLDFSQGNQKYLAELEPTIDAAAAVDGDLYMPYLKNKTPNGPIRLAGRNYPKGLWINTDTALTYKLDGEYREFKATLAIDEAVPVATGTVKVTIDADGKKLYEGTFNRKANKADPVNLNVKDAKVLRINVESDALFTGATLSLGDAKLQK